MSSLPSTCSRATGSPATAAMAAFSITAHTSGAAPIAGAPPSAAGGRTAKPDFFSRDTASVISKGPTASLTMATGFRRSPGGTWTESGRTAQVAGSVGIGSGIDRCFLSKQCRAAPQSPCAGHRPRSRPFSAASTFRASLRSRAAWRASAPRPPCFSGARRHRSRPSVVRGPVEAPPCLWQRPLGIAGARHRSPLRLRRAPQRGAAPAAAKA